MQGQCELRGIRPIKNYSLEVVLEAESNRSHEDLSSVEKKMPCPPEEGIGKDSIPASSQRTMTAPDS